MPLAKWPFQWIVDRKGASCGWALVHSRIVSRDRQAQLAELRHAGVRFLGMSSDGTFPLPAPDDPLDYGMLCEGWCHCFRDPDAMLPPGSPRTLISGSDFTDPHHLSPERILGDPAESTSGFDFVYVAATEPWKQEAKNWPLACECIPVLCRELGLRALVVHSPRHGLVESSAIHHVDHLPWSQWLRHLARARFLFVPNELDASPRVISEALCLDVPVVVNRRILGGWKYVNTYTGCFFDDADNVVAAAAECLAKRLRPRNWYRAHHGPYLAGRRLLAFLRSIDPELQVRDALGLSHHLAAFPGGGRGDVDQQSGRTLHW